MRDTDILMETTTSTTTQTLREMLLNAGNPTAGATRLYFSWLDYTLFVLIMLVSALIGMYFGFWNKKNNTPEEYLHGGKNMAVIPVSVSLTASSISGILLIGIATEVYMYGGLYLWVCAAYIVVPFITYYIYLPVFYELKVTSTYEYLQLRFGASVRLMASAIWTVYQFLYLPIVVYAPAITFSQVSGVDVHIISPVICILCVFYTVVGGIKAVVWTDLLQGIAMLISNLTVVVLGTNEVGGLASVLRRSEEGGRLQLYELSLSPFVRHATVSLIIGKTIQNIGLFTLNQSSVQRYMSLSTYSKVGKSIILSSVGLLILVFLSCFTGLLLYVFYENCDPLKAGIIKKPDQVITHYVTEIANSAPGLPGIFVSGIFSAALSTLSSSLNSLGATIFEDFVRPFLKNKNFSDNTLSNIIKVIILLFGCSSMFMVYIIEHLGNVLQVSVSLAGVVNGPLIGLFTLGMFYPRGNEKGALAGSIVSLAFMSWMVFGTQAAIANGSLHHPRLNTTTAGCNINYTIPTLPKPTINNENVFVLYRISYLYYTVIGLIVMLAISIVVSHLTEPPSEEKTKSVLFSPCIRKYIEKRRKLRLGKEKNEEELDKMIIKQ